MRDSFSKLHPAVLIIYFILQAILSAVCFHPLIIGISLVCCLVFIGVAGDSKTVLTWCGITACYMISFGLINPLINHQGETVLFLVFNKAVTLQSFCYGLLSGGMISAVCMWLYIMGKVLDSRKTCFLFGRFMPSVTLMIFVALRLVRRYQIKIKEIFDARRGIYADEKKFDLIREVSSGLLSFGLENGVDTADSMSARGYGCGTPTQCYSYRFTLKDLVAVIIFTTAVAVVFWGIFNGACKMYFFPKFFVENTYFTVFIAYFVLCAYPLLIYFWSEIKWMFIK